MNDRATSALILIGSVFAVLVGLLCMVIGIINGLPAATFAADLGVQEGEIGNAWLGVLPVIASGLLVLMGGIGGLLYNRNRR